jgi:hypothetical protein
LSVMPHSCWIQTTFLPWRFNWIEMLQQQFEGLWSMNAEGRSPVQTFRFPAIQTSQSRTEWATSCCPRMQRMVRSCVCALKKICSPRRFQFQPAMRERSWFCGDTDAGCERAGIASKILARL